MEQLATTPEVKSSIVWVVTFHMTSNLSGFPEARHDFPSYLCRVAPAFSHLGHHAPHYDLKVEVVPVHIAKQAI